MEEKREKSKRKRVRLGTKMDGFVCLELPPSSIA